MACIFCLIDQFIVEGVRVLCHHKSIVLCKSTWINDLYLAVLRAAWIDTFRAAYVANRIDQYLEAGVPLGLDC